MPKKTTPVVVVNLPDRIEIHQDCVTDGAIGIVGADYTCPDKNTKITQDEVSGPGTVGIVLGKKRP